MLQVVTIDKERLVSEKQNNKACPEGARLPKEAMLLRDIFKFTKPSLDAFRPFGLTSRAYQGPEAKENKLELNSHYYIFLGGNFCENKYFFCIFGKTSRVPSEKVPRTTIGTRTAGWKSLL